MITRRCFVAGLSSCALLTSTSTFAQSTGSIPVVGVLALDNVERIAPLREGLRDLGYVDGKNLRLQIGHPGDRYAKLADVATEFARSRVNVIVSVGGTATMAASKSTQSIPIVMIGGIDPVKEKIAASLAHPGGNVTGISTVLVELTAKRLEFAREAIPGLKDIGILMNPESVSTQSAMPDVKAAAERLKIRLNVAEVRTTADFDAAFGTLARTRSKAFIMLPSNMLAANRKLVLDAAKKHRLAGFFTRPEWANDGGLIAHAASDDEAFKRLASYVDRILRGAKPADLPIEQSTKFDLFVNLRTARDLGIKIPQSVLVQATKVIE